MILSNVDNNALELIFREFFKKYSTYDNLAVDGKWLNGSDISGQYIEESHKAVLNILDKDKKIVVGHQLLSKDKKSEIPAMVTMLQDKSFYLKGQIFSFDALLTQVEFLDLINPQENFYIAKVKGNQKLLKEKVVFTANGFRNPTYSYTSPLFETENNKSVKRFVEVFKKVAEKSDRLKAAKDAGFELFVKRAKIGSSKHVRVRPRFDSWTARGTILVVDSTINAGVLKNLFTVGGSLIGLCDWRPGSPASGRFGQFTAEIKEI
jgi:hypothetical protein